MNLASEVLQRVLSGSRGSPSRQVEGGRMHSILALPRGRRTRTHFESRDLELDKPICGERL